MILIDAACLAAFRGKTRCEWSGKHIRTGLDPHHIHSRGAGRVDHPWNLIALSRDIHTMVHNAAISRFDLLAIVAAREGVLQSDLQSFVWWVRRQPREYEPNPVPILERWRMRKGD